MMKRDFYFLASMFTLSIMLTANVVNAQVDPTKINGNQFWSLDGNAGTEPTVNFLGTKDDQPFELRVNNRRALRIEPTGSTPNLIGGSGSSEVGLGVIGATISGGTGHSVTSDFSTVGGGDGNTVSGEYATVGGGEGNQAIADYATIAGGGEVIPGDHSTANIVNRTYGTVGGGGGNLAGKEAGDSGDAKYATVGGGERNKATGFWATVGGGGDNAATNQWATISGGADSIASGGQSTISGGTNHRALGFQSTIGGGGGNQVSGILSTISGGASNKVFSFAGTVGGGSANEAGPDDCAPENQPSDCEQFGTIGSHATVGGGESNTASGRFSTVSGGQSNLAGGDFSFATGRRVKVDSAHNGAMLFADSNDVDFNSAAPNEFAVRATGGIRFVTAVNANSTKTGAKLAGGSGSWSSSSDRNTKENFGAVNSRDILERLHNIPITQWNYKTQDSSIRHMGPTAQDFYSAFGVGEDDKHISTVDADGVALAAIQGLYKVVQEKDERITALEARLEILEKAIGKAGAPAQLLSSGFFTGWTLIGGLFLTGYGWWYWRQNG